MIQSKLETRALNQSGYQIKFKNYARTHEKKKKKRIDWVTVTIEV
jgi:hypothetical protein